MQEQYTSLAEAIIKHQESVVGPLAWNEADKVAGIKVRERSVSVEGEGKNALSSLVSRYEGLFGQASVEACKDAIRPLLPKMKEIDLPKSLL